MHKHGRPLRIFSVILVVLCSLVAASSAQGQQLAATVQFDSGVVPTAFALDEADGILFVAADVGSSSGAIYAVSVASASIIGSVSFSGQPSLSNSIAYSPATGELYVLSVKPTGAYTAVTNALAINTRANPLTITTLDVGAGPNAIELNPVNGKVYTVNYNDASVSVIDPTDNSVVTIPNLTPHPWNLAFDPGSGEVYVTAAGGIGCNCISNLTVIDPATNAVTATVPVGKLPLALAVDPLTHTVYVGNADAGTVEAVSPSKGYVVTNSITVAPSESESFDLAIDSAGKVYVDLQYSNEVAVIDPANGFSVIDVPVGEQPEVMTFDSGANLMAILNYKSNTVSYISPTTLQVVATVNVGMQAEYTPNSMISSGTAKGTAVTNGGSGTVSFIAD